MDEAKYVYTLSDCSDLVSLALKSIISLRRFVDKKNVIVFYTPPRSEESLSKLSKIAVVKQVQNVTSPFFVTHHGKNRYGEKIHLCTINSPTVVFLDCDTIVKRDISSLFDNNYDFAARNEESFAINDDYRKLFETFNKTTVMMPNSGFMIFKNSTHQKIATEWKNFLNTEKLYKRNCAKEQVSLALALSGYKIKWLTQKECAFTWMYESEKTVYVVHGKPRPIWRKLTKTLKQKLNF